MNEENRKNIERKRKCDDLLAIDNGKIIKTEIEDTSGSESNQSVPLFASSIKKELNVRIKAEPAEENVEDLKNVPNDSPEAIKDECNLKLELFEESETCIQFFNNTTKQPQASNSKIKKQLETQPIIDGPRKIKQIVYENSNTDSDDETKNKIYTSSNVNLNPSADINEPDDNTTENDEIQQNEESFRFNIPSVKPSKKNDMFKEINLCNSIKNRDEFDIFGNYIARTLRSLPGELGIIAKTHIVKALSEFQLKALGQKQTARFMYRVTSCNNPDCSNSSC